MTSPKGAESKKAFEKSSELSQKYYDIALPAMKLRQDSAITALDRGESSLMASAFDAERAGVVEGLSGAMAGQEMQMTRGAKSALSGGNAFSQMHPADIGAKLANALWGSKFKEGQADIEQRLGLMSSIMGGSAAAGNAGLAAAGANLGAVNYLPNVNQGYATALGLADIGASIYGGFRTPGTPQTPPPGQQPYTSSGPYTPPWATPLA